MMAVILKGKEVAQHKRSQIMARVGKLKAMNIYPALNIIMVGGREDAKAYARGASKALSECGISCHTVVFPEDINKERLIEEVSAMNNDPRVHGLLVMRPIPGEIGWDAVERNISPDKDVDCITMHNLSKVFKGKEGGFNPCTAQAVMEILNHYNIDVEGRKVGVVGRSMGVGKPAAMLLLKRNATVTVCHSKTKDLARETSAADVIVAAAGVPKMIGAGHVKKGSIVIDVGINMVSGRLVGDVDFDELEPLVSMITPVPGGVGSVTTTVLMENILTAAERLAGKPG